MKIVVRFASLYALLREKDRALQALENAYRQAESREMPVVAFFDHLRGDPRNLILQLSVGRLVVFGKKLSRFYGNHYRQKHAVGELE